MLLKFFESLRRQNQRSHGDFLRAAEVDAVQSPEGCGRLVLRADVLPDAVLLDADRVDRKLALARHLVLQRVQRMQQPDRESRARTQSGARRQVDRMDDV